ncbi:hypothetical protein ABW19_dt0208843 [Dactylella cylindrospora]|nr:hypothetical protein ABW19_dt0208843 [Dactylella cylindrospora]
MGVAPFTITGPTPSTTITVTETLPPQTFTQTVETSFSTVIDETVTSTTIEATTTIQEVITCESPSNSLLFNPGFEGAIVYPWTDTVGTATSWGRVVGSQYGGTAYYQVVHNGESRSELYQRFNTCRGRQYYGKLTVDNGPDPNGDCSLTVKMNNEIRASRPNANTGSYTLVWDFVPEAGQTLGYGLWNIDDIIIRDTVEAEE